MSIRSSVNNNVYRHIEHKSTLDPNAQPSELVLLCLKTLGTLYTPHIGSTYIHTYIHTYMHTFMHIHLQFSKTSILGTDQTMRNIYHTLLPMVQHSVLPYLNSSDRDVRKEVNYTYSFCLINNNNNNNNNMMMMILGGDDRNKFDHDSCRAVED